MLRSAGAPSPPSSLFPLSPCLSATHSRSTAPSISPFLFHPLTALRSSSVGRSVGRSVDLSIRRCVWFRCQPPRLDSSRAWNATELSLPPIDAHDHTTHYTTITRPTTDHTIDKTTATTRVGFPRGKRENVD